MRTFPVVETFGPVIQGEGPLAGRATNFVRFGGCDYRCSWCDSLYAVIPSQVRANSSKKTVDEIIAGLLVLQSPSKWVTLSGGNPAMLKLDDLVSKLSALGFAVSVETQGSVFARWLLNVDSLVISPKPPSSGMADKTDSQLAGFMQHVMSHREPLVTRDGLKVVVFDEEDFEWAINVFRQYEEWPAYVSVGTDPPADGETLAVTIGKVTERFRWLSELVATSPDCADMGVRALPQLHVLAYGHLRGV